MGLLASPEIRAGDEAYWRTVREAYTVPTDFTQLEYGWYHPGANRVLAAEMEAMRQGQLRGAHYKRGEMNAEREAARVDLARVAGADPEEVILTRNATEALAIVIRGMPLASGDGIVHSDQDYPSVVEAIEQRARTEGVVAQTARLPLHPHSDDEVVRCFEAAVTPRTRAIVITHVINHSGQVVPVRAVAEMARRHRLQVIVDAAHSFGQLAYTVKDLDCDYLGSSLHKWLGAPLGTGLLFVRRDRIEALQPLFPDTRLPATDVRKLEHFGNRPDSAHRGLREAIRWHESIGTPVKQARLNLLQRRWTSQVRSLPRVKLLTPADPARHGAIGTFAVEGMEPETVARRLLEEHRIFVNAVHHPVVRGVRVTPGLPSSVVDIDAFVEALRSIAR
ncbi:MAG: aminotransferase class V-fold PLP-dependent enzyme [Opitutaceae bacterium]|nr:aminotransferase class V-fold PLP-dependent enzyme [Opitutaceae bacterium]